MHNESDIDLIRKAVIHRIDSNKVMRDMSKNYKNKRKRKSSMSRNSHSSGINLKENVRNYCPKKPLLADYLGNANYRSKSRPKKSHE